MRHSKLLIAVFSATVMMALAVSSASAAHLSTGNQNFRTVYTSLNFAEPSGFFGTISCRVTMEGSFHSATIAKVIGSLIGYVTRATAATCTGGGATINQPSLPWHVRYGGFTGTLPSIT